MKKIVVDCQPLVHGLVPIRATALIDSIMSALVQEFPSWDWVFLLDNTGSALNLLDTATLQKSVFKKIFGNFIGWKWWYGYQLPKWLRTHHADLLITTGGIAAQSRVPQLVWMPALSSAERLPANYLGYFRRQYAKTLEHARYLLVLSTQTRGELLHQGKLPQDKTLLLTTGPDPIFRNLSWSEKESVKTRFAAGKEFFLVLSDQYSDPLLDILKAFSVFKKRQQSNMQLVFAGAALAGNDAFLQKLSSFTYKSSVHVLKELLPTDLASLLAASYAALIPSMADETHYFLKAAIWTGVPLILPPGYQSDVLDPDAALFADMQEPEILASRLMTLFKDENKRSSLIAKAGQHFDQINAQKSFSELKNILLST